MFKEIAEEGSHGEAPSHWVYHSHLEVSKELLQPAKTCFMVLSLYHLSPMVIIKLFHIKVFCSKFLLEGPIVAQTPSRKQCCKWAAVGITCDEWKEWTPHLDCIYWYGTELPQCILQICVTVNCWQLVLSFSCHQYCHLLYKTSNV